MFHCGFECSSQNQREIPQTLQSSRGFGQIHPLLFITSVWFGAEVWKTRMRRFGRVFRWGGGDHGERLWSHSQAGGKRRSFWMTSMMRRSEKWRSVWGRGRGGVAGEPREKKLQEESVTSQSNVFTSIGLFPRIFLEQIAGYNLGKIPSYYFHCLDSDIELESSSI